VKHNKTIPVRVLTSLALSVALTLSLFAGTAFAAARNDGELLHLGFDEGQGITVSDLSGHLSAAQVQYGFTDAAFMDSQEPQWRDKGAAGGCLLFDGCTTYVEYPNSALRVSGDSLTVSAWVAPRAFDWDDPNGAENGSDTLTAIVDQADRGGRRGFILGYQRYGVLSFQVGTGDSWLTLWTNGDKLTTYAWNHVVATYDAGIGEMALYLNGERVSSRSVPRGAAIAPSDRPLMVGRNGSAGRYDASLLNLVSGYLDEVTLRRGALTETEVAAAYRAAAPAAGLRRERVHRPERLPRPGERGRGDVQHHAGSALRAGSGRVRLGAHRRACPQAVADGRRLRREDRPHRRHRNAGGNGARG